MGIVQKSLIAHLDKCVSGQIFWLVGGLTSTFNVLKLVCTLTYFTLAWEKIAFLEEGARERRVNQLCKSISVL